MKETYETWISSRHRILINTREVTVQETNENDPNMYCIIAFHIELTTHTHNIIANEHYKSGSNIILLKMP